MLANLTTTLPVAVASIVIAISRYIVEEKGLLSPLIWADALASLRVPKCRGGLSEVIASIVLFFCM